MDKPLITDYEIEFCCGSGAYGDVWLAKDRDGLTRAIKVLDRLRLANLGVLGREEKSVRLFRTKVPEHPGLIRILHTGETQSIIYYVMEPADNCAPEGMPYTPDTVENRIRQHGAMPPDKVIALMNSLLSAVECLHNAGIAHRDIKPSNIIFIMGQAKLADMGLVSTDGANASIAGTQCFIPPYRCSGSAADLYALGKLLYCCYTGLGAEHFPSLPASLYLADAEFLNRIAIRACAKEPAERFQTVSDLKTAFLLRSPRRSRFWTKERSLDNVVPYVSERSLLLIIILLLTIILSLILFYSKRSLFDPNATDDEYDVYLIGKISADFCSISK